MRRTVFFRWRLKLLRAVKRGGHTEALCVCRVRRSSDERKNARLGDSSGRKRSILVILSFGFAAARARFGQVEGERGAGDPCRFREEQQAQTCNQEKRESI